jgi:hypothetical protein
MRRKRFTSSCGKLPVLDVAVETSQDLVEALELVGRDLTCRAHHHRVLGKEKNK